MNDRFAPITRCIDLCEEHIVEAAADRDAARALLQHLAAVSRPGSGAAKALLVYARMATTACDWIDGDLCIDLVSQSDVTTIEASTELGGGLRERLFQPMRFRAPIEEFARAIARVPHMIAPLSAQSVTPLGIRLSATAQTRRTTAPPPPPIEISSESLFARRPPPGPEMLGSAPELARALVGFTPLSASEPPLPLVRVTPSPVDAMANRRPALPSAPPLRDVDEGWDEK